jgi:hypothetical protein
MRRLRVRGRLARWRPWMRLAENKARHEQDLIDAAYDREMARFHHRRQGQPRRGNTCGAHAAKQNSNGRRSGASRRDRGGMGSVPQICGCGGFRRGIGGRSGQARFHANGFLSDFGDHELVGGYLRHRMGSVVFVLGGPCRPRGSEGGRWLWQRASPLLCSPSHLSSVVVVLTNRIGRCGLDPGGSGYCAALFLDHGEDHGIDDGHDQFRGIRLLWRYIPSGEKDTVNHPAMRMHFDVLHAGLGAAVAAGTVDGRPWSDLN